MAEAATAEALQELDLRRVLAKSNQDYPFNNIATTCRLMGEADVPEWFGGDCYDQVTRAIGLIREAGARALYISSGVHFALFLPDTDGGAYLDPTLNMREPISMDSLRSGEMARAQTFPVVRGVSSFIGARLEGNVLKSDWYRAISQGNQVVTRKLPPSNSFALTDAVESFDYAPERVKEFFRSSMVPRVSWNVIDTETGEMITVTVGGEVISLRSSAQSGRIVEGNDGYDALMERVANVTKASRQEIDEFLRLWRAKFNELKAGV